MNNLVGTYNRTEMSLQSTTQNTKQLGPSLFWSFFGRLNKWAIGPTEWNRERSSDDLNPTKD